MAQLADDAAHQPPKSIPTPREGEVYESGEGWVAFACIALFIAGTMNVIGGIAAIDNANFFVGNVAFIVGDLESLGWILLIIGVIQMLAPIAIRAGSFAGVWVGIVSAGLNGVAHLLLIPAAPYWCIAIFALDMVVIYGLVVYAEAE